MTTLKELRMWHWRQVIKCRKAQRHNEQEAEKLLEGRNYLDDNEHQRLGRYKADAKSLGELADLHLSAVQVLNDSVPGVAEYDCIEADAIITKKGTSNEHL